MSAWVVSKRHIDILVQSALAGPSDADGWTHPGMKFSWYHDEMRHEIDQFAEVGDTRSNGHVEIVPPSLLGQRLVSECVASVHDRYPNDDVDAGELPGPIDAYYMGPYVFEPFTDPNVMLIGAGGLTVAIQPLVTSVELAKGIACYEYQSCEHDAWEDSEAHAFCQAMKENILSSLPGYDAAPWGWD